MGSLLNSMVENQSLHEVAKAWGVGSDQAARRVRAVPFVVLSHANPGGAGGGRPGRRLSLDPSWQFRGHAGKRPLGELLKLFRMLHSLGEPFALGVPFTSTFWRPFLNPEVRLLAPPATFSLWRRLFAGTVGALRVVVDLLPESAETTALGLAARMFWLQFAWRLGISHEDAEAVFLEAERMALRSGDIASRAILLSLYGRALPEDAMTYAASRGVDRDVRYLEDHRRREGRVVRADEVREAHQRANEMARVPPETKFRELLGREALGSD